MFRLCYVLFFLYVISVYVQCLKQQAWFSRTGVVRKGSSILLESNIVHAQ